MINLIFKKQEATLLAHILTRYLNKCLMRSFTIILKVISTKAVKKKKAV